MKIRGFVGMALLALAVTAVYFLLRPVARPPETGSAAAVSQAAPAPASGPVSARPEPTPSITPIASSFPRNAAGFPPPTPGPTLPVPTPGARPGVVAPPAPRGPESNGSAEVELDKIHHMITSYHTLMGENPVGTNAEIMKAIMGGNPRQATLGDRGDQVLNGKGELVDPWGTPYFFHQLSRDRMEIHSAGPDKVMGTDDDQVIQ